MKKNKKEVSLVTIIHESVVKIFVLAMIMVFPLIFRNNYIDIARTKLAFFKTAALVLTGLTVYFGIIRIVQSRSEFRKEKWHVSLTDVCAVGFAGTILVSCLLSDSGSEAFFGMTRRRMGGLVFLLCITVYFIISRYYRYTDSLLWFFLAGNGAVWLLLALNFWGMDPLQMYQNLSPGQYGVFIGTIGNINVAAGYGSVILAVVLVWYYLSESRYSRRIYFGMILLGTYACYGTKSESWLLGAGAAMAVLLWDALEEQKKFWKFQKICWGLWTASAAMSLSVSLMMYKGWAVSAATALMSQQLVHILLKKEILAAEFLLLLVIAIVSKKWGAYGLVRVRKIIFAAAGAGILGLFLAVMVSNMMDVTWEWQKYFKIQDSFGSGRGFIWKNTVAEYGQQPLLQKLFGCGPNCFKQFIDQSIGAELQARGLPSVWDAHNEALQSLATTGIFGMISYFGMQIGTAARCMAKRKNNPLLLTGAAGLAAYMGQGMVNNPQVFITPLLFVFMGILESALRKNN